MAHDHNRLQKDASNLLHSMGLSYTRPTYTLQKSDPKKPDTLV
ncbi:winged helix-turn-helix domain-containing protein [Planococcus kocurii]|nr:winged helix-turn-helix domain-containing protein [Planococcus sp. ANT_H30]KAA0956038.1 winged helix-turn-helix domain-containing protein [Planococcus sp. ANT_H30]